MISRGTPLHRVQLLGVYSLSRCSPFEGAGRGSLSEPIYQMVMRLVAASAPSQDESQTEATVWDPARHLSKQGCVTVGLREKSLASSCAEGISALSQKVVEGVS